jgi:hypothetical protein
MLTVFNHFDKKLPTSETGNLIIIIHNNLGEGLFAGVAEKLFCTLHIIIIIMKAFLTLIAYIGVALSHEITSNKLIELNHNSYLEHVVSN